MRKWILVSIVAVLLLTQSENIPQVLSGATLPVRRVNAPYFSGQIDYSQTAIFWYGQVTASDAYTDVRVGYSDSKLYIHLNIMDRNLWYDTNPTADTLDQWDAATIYLNMDGNAGSTLGANAYQFTTQLSGYVDNPLRWRAAWRSNGSGWTSIAVPYTPELGSNGTMNNNSDEDRGWVIDFHIPFANLGLSGPPPQGTVWGLAVATHNRDSLAGPVIHTTWPNGVDLTSPQTWGQLRFGIPTFAPASPVTQRFTTKIRQGLNGAVVPDGAVGGGFTCGGELNYWTQWGAKNYAGEPNFNVQNQSDISDWPCFSKYFVTFPLSSIPAGKAIVSATLTLYQFGNAGAGWNPGPVPSFLQVLALDQDWNESTLTWNNAPQARENLTGTWVAPIDPNNPPPYPGGIAYSWDVSRSVAESYAAGQPLRLAVYSADEHIHSGRYFYSSDVEALNAQGRPTLQVTWGQTGPSLKYSASPLNPLHDQLVTYTLALVGSGNGLTLTAVLPPQLSAPGPLTVIGSGSATYSAGLRQITWLGSPAAGAPVTVTFPVTVLVTSPMLLSSTAVLTDTVEGTAQATTNVIANPYQVWLPVTLR